MVTLKIDGIEVTVPPGTMILEAAAKAGIRIPTLCHNKRLIPFGACRICVVQQKGRRGLIPACFNPVRNGMEILTNSPEIIQARRTQLQLILIDHAVECPICDAGGRCQLQNLVYEYGVADNPFKGPKANWPVDHVSPFIERNLNRCILCGRCVRIDDEVVGANELSFIGRGRKTKIGTDFDRPMNCEFCGQCVSVCPVGALNDRIFLHKARIWDLKETQTTCAYCGVGCSLTVGTRDDRILRIRAKEELGINQGNLCVKGRYGWEYVHSRERLITPLIRKNGVLVKATWEEALSLVAKRFQELKKDRTLAGLCSPRLTNEELYTFQKFMRGVVGTNHFDHAGGYSYAANLTLRDSLGFAASTNSLNEIRTADVILALRCDLSETHPVVKSEVVLAVKRQKAKLIVINSRNIYLNKFSNLTLLVKPGTEAVLVNGILQAILEENLGKEDFIQTQTEGLDSLRPLLQGFSPENVSSRTGVAAAQVREAARLFAGAKKAMILISTGQASDRQDPALAGAASNLALLTGHLGKEGSGVFLLGEKNNSQGALDMGVTPGLLPGYADLGDPAERNRFEESWRKPIPAETGLSALEILQAVENGKVKGLYLAGENPLGNYPDSGRIQKALVRLEFLVVQDCFLSETASLAQVVLPAVPFAEKEGTYTNSERRVQRVRPALKPQGEALPDLWIFQELANRLGASWGHGSPREVMEEIRSLVKIYGGVDFGHLDGPKGLQWPCPSPDHPGTPVLYLDGFPRGKARFLPPSEGAGEERDPEYPLTLLTGPVLFHSGSLSAHSPGLQKIRGENFVEIHPEDAQKFGLAEGETAVLESKQGKCEVKVQISSKGAPGVLFLPYAFGTKGGHQLTSWDLGKTRVKLGKAG
ncbi:MAG: putative anaerobic dehydrogenase [Deltaproteobacteria bacterium]|nr:putative anaerobic dehydrogenase [Deltaproteobacteria bacterium]